ncbi:flagellar basal body rod modification protein [Clostridium acetireducens DSM 10703]|jgi:flagellar basal-body rod modification protein FlgD|uniref:Flagellar basal body rod modification protein n=1 Tax=Clostridium acetireducens DSM 10703 TaxID=1121290 RepID=A0A1E8F0Y0_9CLOT|nr:flagellar hook capping FlgD N-terminal domain-containing protein [Clostridium acetireducens]OFI06810.1 flagellar basal body rod modification protein [Clostridium acetireducens DSM 10703]
MPVNSTNGTNYIKGQYTEKGTRIVKPGQEMDKNAFLKILAAELSNQDPMNAKDGTEFVAQMAQFSGLEQMANLNNTMRLTASASFVGKDVMLNSLDDKGNLYRGIVSGISKDGDTIKLNVVVGKLKDKDGNEYDDVKQFKMEDIIELRNSSSKDFYYDVEKGKEEKENEILENKVSKEI